jgi:hypothetical protein
MSDNVTKVDYFSMELPNKAGAAAEVLDVLRDNDVNLLAFTGFPLGRRAQVDFIPADSAAFRKVARGAKWPINPRKSGFLIQGDDHAGAVADLLSRLAEIDINVTAVDAVCAGQGRYGAILWVRPEDVTKAGRALTQRGRRRGGAAKKKSARRRPR